MALTGRSSDVPDRPTQTSCYPFLAKDHPMTDQSPTAGFIAGRTACKIEAMKRAGIVVADSPAGLREAVLKAIRD